MNKPALLAAAGMALAYFIAMELMPTASAGLRYAMLAAFLYIGLTTPKYLSLPTLRGELARRIDEQSGTAAKLVD